MSMTIQSGNVSYNSDPSALIEKLKAAYPNLDVSQYNKIAEHSVGIEDDVEKYVMSWYVNLFYPQYYQAYYAETRPPELADEFAAMETDVEALVGDDVWMLADESVIPMPKELRAALIAKLEAATGETYTGKTSSSDSGSSTGSETQNDEVTSSLLSSKAFNGFKGLKNDDVSDALRLFPSNSVQGQMLGFLGDQVLLSRNVQAQSAIALKEISEAEAEIMSELGSLRSSGMSADDPLYTTKMEELKQKMGDLSASKEMYMSYISQSSQRTQEIVTLLSGFLKELNQSMQQLASNFRVA